MKTVPSNGIPTQNKTPAAQRLDVLEGFLKQDPANSGLLAETFDAALSAGRLERSSELLSRARQTLSGNAEASAWTFREVNLNLARKQYPEARALLLELQAHAGAHPSISHNLGWIEFVSSDYESCLQHLRPWVDSGAQDVALDLAQLQVIQVLWLRALHRAQQLDEAWSWVETQLKAQRLTPAAAGVASLIAVDLDEMKSVRVLADAALAHDPLHLEALVARATVALSARDQPLARRLLKSAAGVNPDDGRTLAMMGFADLLSGDLSAAGKLLDRAVIAMPDHVGTWVGLGWVKFLQRDLPGARKVLEQAILVNRNFAEAHGSLAVVQLQQGEDEVAKASIARALGLDAGSLSARYAQAIVDGEAGDAAAVQVLARRLLRGQAAPLGGDVADWLPGDR